MIKISKGQPTITIKLIDADSLLYRAGFVANEEGQEALALWQLDQMLDSIVDNDDYLFISGSENFRYKIYPEYKANRKDMKRPIHLNALREHIVSKWGATVSSDGREADDVVSIVNHQRPGMLISHIDKDLNMLPGDHWNYVTKEYYTVSNQQAYRNFYIQLLMGDRADNIPGFDLKMRTKVPKFMEPVMQELEECQEAAEMLDIVAGWYQEDWQRLDISARCLWLLRKEEDDWTEWLEKDTMVELGRWDDLTALLEARSAQPVDDGLQSLNV